jgi:hypothetical protein
MAGFTAHISTCENGRDKVLPVCQCGAEAEIEHELIISRGPKESDMFEETRGPRITYEQVGLAMSPGPKEILFSGDTMTVVVSSKESIEVDISELEDEEKQDLKAVAKALFR